MNETWWRKSLNRWFGGKDGRTRPRPARGTTTRAPEFRASDAFIASYPRSGNTWLRVLLADVVQQCHGVETDTQLPIHEDEVIPDMDRGDAVVPHARLTLPCRLIKTHGSWQPFMKRVVWILRLPASSLTSYYHFHRRYPELEKRASGGIDRFCLSHLDDWLDHARSFQQAIDERRANVLVVTYEQLHSDTMRELDRICRFLDLKAQPAQLRIAVNNHAFERQRATEKESGLNGEFFFRFGQIDSAKSELADSTYRLLNRRGLNAYREAMRLRAA